MLHQHSGHKWFAATLGGLCTFLLLGPLALAQEKGKEPAKEGPKEGPKAVEQKLHSLVRAGYTRPGSPPDRIHKSGQIVPLALDPEYNGAMIGSTVYFAVFKLATERGDGVHRELEAYADKFIEGTSFENTVSPSFDRKANYLYLYQIVNDRGLDPVKDGVVPAAKDNIRSLDVASFLLRLNVDPRYITSWGAFRNVGFAANVTERKQSGDIVEAADGKGAVILPMAFSSNPSVLSMLPHKRYTEGSPAYSLETLFPTFDLAPATLNLKKTFAYNALAKKVANKVALANWEDGEYKAAEEAREPDFVQLVYQDFRPDLEPNLDGRDLGSAAFRVDFKKNNLVKLGMHSVVFGFTTDLPPTDEPIRIEPLPGKGDIKAVGDGQAGGIALAVGTAPSPAPVGGFAASGPVATLGGTGGGGGFGGGFGFPGIAGVLGVARAPGTGGGSGNGDGGGNGDGNGQSQSLAQQAQAQAQDQSAKINFNATLINQQSQKQSQSQWQAQWQSQKNINKNNNCNKCPVVPAPAALILGMLGLPAFYLFRRRPK